MKEYRTNPATQKPPFSSDKVVFTQPQRSNITSSKHLSQDRRSYVIKKNKKD
jgi:hypothetical protein